MAASVEDTDRAYQLGMRGAALFPEIYQVYDDALTAGRPIAHPRPLQLAAPVYPFDRRAALRQGQVWVAFVVNENGSVAQAKPVVDDAYPPDEQFARAAVAAVTQWKFTPGTIDGRPASFVMVQPISFGIETGNAAGK